MSALSPQQLLGSNLRVKAIITKRHFTDGTNAADEGPAEDVRYDADVTEAPGGYQIAGRAGIRAAMPVGRPTNQAVIEYAKVGHACDIFFPKGSPPELYVYSEHILFDQCEPVAPDPGTFVAEGE